MLTLLLNVVTSGTEAFVASGNKVLYAYELSHVLTPSINSSLLLKRCDPNEFFR
jgi:hypothetical protein